MTIFRSLSHILTGLFLLAVLACVPHGARAQTLYVSSESTNQIFAINTGTGAAAVVLSGASGFLASPEGLAYFAPTGDLYIANGGGISLGGTSGSIVRYNTFTGTTSLFYAANDSTVLDSPQGLAFDASGNLFVTGYNSGTIVEFVGDGNGNLNAAAPVTFATGLTSPYYLAFDQSGGLFVANPGAATAPEIRRYSAANTFTTFEAGATAGTGTLDAPIGLAFKGNTLFSSDTLNNTIVGFNNASGDTSTRTTADVVFTPTGGAALNSPQALAYDNSLDVLYVANFGTPNQPDGNIVRVNASSGVTSVLFSGITNPTGLALATPEPPAGVLYLGGMAVASAGGAFLRARRRHRAG